MVGQHAGNPPSTHLRGLGSTCSSPAPPPTDRHLALDQLPWSARRRARRRSLDACEAAPSLASTLVRATHGQRSTIPCLPGPIRAATTKPLTDHSDPSNPVHQPWPVPPHRCIRIQRGCSGRGHRTRVRPDTRITPVVWTPGAWTPDAWTPDARTPDVHPTSWTDVRPHGGQRTRTERRTAWPTSGHPGRHDDGDRRMGSQSSLGLPRLRRSATP
jgi:hypothetical protein